MIVFDIHIHKGEAAGMTQIFFFLHEKLGSDFS